MKSLIHKTSVSGSIPCEVSAVVRNVASGEEYSVQNQKHFFLSYEITNMWGKVTCFQCKISKQLKCVIRTNWSAAVES